MGWCDGMLAALDFETTGPDPTQCRVVQWAFAYCDGKGDRKVRSGLVNPGEPIPEAATAVHGITNEQVQDAPPFYSPDDPSCAHEHLRRALTWARVYDVPLVIFNVPFDLTLWLAECARAGVERGLGEPGYEPPVVDPLVIDRKVDRYRKGKRTLARAVEVYGVAGDLFHAADADCLMAIDVARAVVRKAGIDCMDPRAAVDWQRACYEDWKANFNVYRAGKGEPPITDTWPVRVQEATTV